MTNADVFKIIFGMTSTELWSMEHEDFIAWTNEEAISHADLPKCGNCKYNYGLMHGGEFWDEDIVCEIFLTDGLTANDFCSFGEKADVEAEPTAKVTATIKDTEGNEHAIAEYTIPIRRYGGE